jgi:UDP-2,4-diacetamido-2,4,6-trideoxy-beta-L-altropyranose hydrolase
MRVALRTDASGRIGTGHLRRCLALARALNDEGAETLFVCRRHDEFSTLIEREGQALAWLPQAGGEFRREAGDPPHAHWAGVPWSQDAAETVQALRDWRPDWVVIDHYAFDARWHEAVAAALQVRCAAIDDLADRPLAVDLLVDHNAQPEGQDKYGARAAGARRLLGPRYALLAGAYAHAPRYRFRRRVGSIGIFMGGADPDDFGGRALLACREQAGFRGMIELVSSARSPHFAAHQALAGRWPDTRVLADLPDLAAFFARHDLQIGSGGGAAWERCCVGAPTLAIQVAANQAPVLSFLAARGAAERIGTAEATIERIGAAVRSLLEQPRRRLALVRASLGLVDGRGSARVAAVITQAGATALSMRPAQRSDEALLLEWANDPQVRANAFTGGAIAPAGHAAWFAARLARPGDCCILIAESAAGVPVGQVRFDREDAQWTIGYSLDAAFRGWGLGGKLLAGALESFRSRFPGAQLRALVKADNQASLRVFRALGFAESTGVVHDVPCHIFLLKP